MSDHYCCKSCGLRYDGCRCLPRAPSPALSEGQIKALNNLLTEPKSSDDLLLWPDGTWCEARDIDQYAHMSDDYERIPTDSVRAASLRGEFDPHA